jgi:hypothetical protein
MEEERAAVVLGFQGVVQHKCSEEWNGYALGKLTSRELRIQRGRAARATAAAMCQSTGSSRGPWRLRRRVSGEWSRLGEGRKRRVEGEKQEVERRPGELYRRRSRGGRENRAEHVLGEEEERGGGPGTCLQNIRIIGTLR